MARVRGVIERSTPAGSRLNVPGSTSTKTGVAPAITMVVAEATKENAEVMTSSPGLTPTALSARSRASVPEPVPTPWRAPHTSASSRSSALPSGPRMNRQESSTRAAASISSARSASCCRLRSIWGIISEARPGRGAHLTQTQEVDRDAKLVLVTVTVHVFGHDGPAAEAPVDAHPVLDRPPSQDVPGGGPADVDVAQHLHQRFRLQVPVVALLVETGTDRHREPRIHEADVRVGLPQAQIVDIVPGIGVEADPLVGFDREIAVEVLQGLGDRAHLEGLAHRETDHLPAPRLLVGAGHRLGIQGVGQVVGDLVGLAEPIDTDAPLVAGIDAVGGARARIVLGIVLLVDAADLDDPHAGLDHVLVGRHP